MGVSIRECNGEIVVVWSKRERKIRRRRRGRKGFGFDFFDPLGGDLSFFSNFFLLCPS